MSAQPRWLSGVLLVGVSCLGGCSRSSPAVPQAAVEPDAAPPRVVEQPPVAHSDDAATPAFYSVAHYDEASDPAADLAQTLDRARAERKRVILQVGAEWCGWCALIAEFMHENERVRRLLDGGFVVMKVTSSGDHADAFLDAYPEVKGLPHIFVLDSDGALLHSQGTAELEQGHGYNEDAFVAFLEAWAPGAGG